MKKVTVLGFALIALMFQAGCASLGGGQVVCAPQRNGITVFGTPDAYYAMYCIGP